MEKINFIYECTQKLFKYSYKDSFYVDDVVLIIPIEFECGYNIALDYIDDNDVNIYLYRDGYEPWDKIILRLHLHKSFKNKNVNKINDFFKKNWDEIIMKLESKKLGLL